MQLWVVVAAFLIVNVEAARFFNRVRLRNPKCRPLRCGKNCEVQATPNDCPKCICTPKCPVLTCPKDCTISQQGEYLCPSCECELETQKKEGITLDSIEQTPIQCPPPKCPFDCEIEREYNGPCPGCKCKDNGDLDLIKPETPCPPLECTPGCKLDKELDGKCSRCKCQKEEDTPIPNNKDMCDPIRCRRGCMENIGATGCPVCFCRMAPKCDPGCRLQRLPGDRYPKCYCIELKSDTALQEKLDKERNVCEPLVNGCPGPDCLLKLDTKGCGVCDCTMPCKISRCDFGCMRVRNGRCPVCICSVLSDIKI